MQPTAPGRGRPCTRFCSAAHLAARPWVRAADDAERAQAAAAQHHDVSLSNMPFLWHRGGDFHKDGHAVPLLYR